MYKQNIWVLLPTTAAYLILNIAQAKPINIPKQLQGDWFELSAEGKKNCASYRKHKDESQVITSIFRIGKHDFKRYAEYGEGNYYVPYSIKKLPQNTWETTGRMYIDVGDIGDARKMMSIPDNPKDDISKKDTTYFKLQKDTLFVDPNSAYELKLFKCLIPNRLN